MPLFSSDIFSQDIALVLTGEGMLVTLYLSRRDEAMKASEKLDGYVFAVDANGERLVVPGFDTVDVTNINTFSPGSSDFTHSRFALSDSYSIINKSVNATLRFLLSLVEPEKEWKKKACLIFEKQMFCSALEAKST